MKKWQNKRQEKTKQSLRGIVKFQYYLHQNVHNRHDFYFIVSPILSQVSQVLLLQQKQNKQKKKKKEKKILLLSQFTNKLSIVCPVPLALALY